MPKKKVDSRVRTLIENCVKTRQRSLFVVVGDRGKYQVVNLHYMLTKAQVKTKPSVLWCYDKELGFSTCVPSSQQPVKRRCAEVVSTLHFPQAPAKAHAAGEADAGQGGVERGHR